MLVNQRNAWVEEFDVGERPALLEAYEVIRNSELGRLSAQVEELAEYALYLEYKLSRNSELTLCSVCNQTVTEPHYQCAESDDDWMRKVHNNWKHE